MKPALSAARTLSVLNHLTVHPREVFSLTELSAALNVSPASMSAVLLAMCDAGYLERHPRHRTYALGPAAVAVGHAASERHPVVEAARPELRRLAGLGSESIGSAAVGDDIMILAIEGRPSGQSRGTWIGHRIPLVPPFGGVFVAWRPPSEIEAWLRRLGAAADTHRGHLQRSLDVGRRRRFFVGLRNDPVEAVVQAVHRTTEHPEAHDRARLQALIADQVAGYALDEVDPAAVYDVANIAVPVFGSDGTVVYALTLYGLLGISGSRLLTVADQMLSSAQTVCRAIDGRPPADLRG